MKKRTKIYEYTADKKAQTYLTPHWITNILGPFDLDPCASDPRPWDIAKTCYTGSHTGGICGLTHSWKGFVWLNPPFGAGGLEKKFVQKLSEHAGGGIALVNVKPATKLWSEIILPKASAILFFSRRISFLDTSGQATTGTFGSQCLIAFGITGEKRLKRLIKYGSIVKVTLNMNGEINAD